jgi:3-oxoacyl-[acyl-carrier protein] reductase
MMSGELSLLGKAALVTGAGRGLGRSYALHLARLGADVAVLDADLRSYAAFTGEAAAMTADSTVDEVKALGRRAFGYEVDVSDAAAMEQAIAAVVRDLGGVDIAVCNAGGATGAPAETLASEVSAEMFDVVVQRNLYGTVNTCRPVAAVMKAQRSGRIVTVSSQAARRASPDGGYAHYGAAKAGVVMYTRYLAQDLGPYGITVNCIAPGYISTGRLAEQFERIGVEQITKSIALRRIGTPEDCARVVEFLVGELGGYVTGSVIPVDGGSVR